jgi:hypothetical protein
VEERRATVLKTIRELPGRDPFVPFRIIMSSGDRCEIDDPRLIAPGATEIVCGRPRSDRFAHLRVAHIAAVELIEKKPAA